MHILAIESSMFGASVGLLRAETLVEETVLDSSQKTAKTLAPAMHDILQKNGWKPRDVELVAVAVGPGSFTGLRIGLTAAKTFAYATGASILGVNTLEVLAAQAPPSDERLWTVMNAERKQLFAAAFQFRTGTWSETIAPHIVDASSWIEALVPGDQLTGPALTELRAKLPAEITLVAEPNWTPRAATVGRVAFRHFQSGRRDDVWSLLPQYLRESAAQEKANP